MADPNNDVIADSLAKNNLCFGGIVKAVLLGGKKVGFSLFCRRSSKVSLCHLQKISID